MNNIYQSTSRPGGAGLNFRPLRGTHSINLREALTLMAVPLADLASEQCTHDFLVMNPSPQLEQSASADERLNRLWANFDPDFL